MQSLMRCWSRLGVFLISAVLVFGIALSAVPVSVHAAKTVQIVYPAGLDLEKGGMLAGWDLFMKGVKVEPVILKGQGSVARALASEKVDVGNLDRGTGRPATAKS